jgi:glycosyltransferase involved in cell wall biosynthesis
MASGLPAIATDYPGVRAVVDEGENGTLVPRGDAGAVAAALRELVEAGPEARRSLGEAGRAKALREWSWPRLLDRMDRVYAEAIEARAAKGRR